MPQYFTSNNVISDTQTSLATRWIVDDRKSLEEAKIEKDSVGKANEVAQDLICRHVCLENEKLIGSIQQIQFTQTWNFTNRIIIQFSSEAARTKLSSTLKDILEYQIPPVESSKTAPFTLAYTANFHNLVENYHPIFLAVNMIEPLPLPMLQYLFNVMRFKYQEHNERTIVHTLFQAYQDGRVHSNLIQRAMTLASGYGTADMFLTIASYLSQHGGLERFALQAAQQGLELIHNNATVKTYTARETLAALHFRAGNALRFCNLEFLKKLSVSKPESTANDKTANENTKKASTTAANTTSTSAAVTITTLGSDLKDVKEAAELPKSLEDDEDIVIRSTTLNTFTELNGSFADKIETEIDRYRHALAHFLQITDPNSKFYVEAQKARTELFASLAGAGVGAVDPQNRVAILGANRMVDTLYSLALKMQNMQTTISEQSTLLGKNGESPEKLLNDRKEAVERLSKEMAQLKIESQNRQEKIMSLEKSSQTTAQSLNDHIAALKKEKEAEISKLKAKEQELSTSEENSRTAQSEIAGLRDKHETAETALLELKAEKKKLEEALAKLKQNQTDIESSLEAEKKAHAVTKLELQSRKNTTTSTGASSSASTTSSVVPESLATSASNDDSTSPAILTQFKATTTTTVTPTIAASEPTAPVPASAVPASANDNC